MIGASSTEIGGGWNIYRTLKHPVVLLIAYMIMAFMKVKDLNNEVHDDFYGPIQISRHLPNYLLEVYGPSFSNHAYIFEDVNNVSSTEKVQSFGLLFDGFH